MLAQRLGIHYNNYVLSTNDNDKSNYFSEIHQFISDFICSLWDNPESIAKILSIAGVIDVGKNLAYFVTYLYENIVSSDSQEDQLLYIITLLLKEEIEKLNYDDDESFLNKKTSPCGYILMELLEKKEVKYFFKIVIKSLMKKIEMFLSLNSMIFDPDKISDTIKKKKYINENEEIRKKLEAQFILVEGKYFTSLTTREMKEKIKEYNNIEITNFLNEMIKQSESDPSKYSFDHLIDMISEKEDINKIYEYYKESYAKIIDIIDLLLEALLKQSNSLPYFIKCICKIISVLIEKKFPQKIKMKQNAYLANFFFGKLLFLAFKNPALYTLLNEHLILGKTMEIFQLLEKILTKFTSGKLFEKDEKDHNDCRGALRRFRGGCGGGPQDAGDDGRGERDRGD